MGSGQNQDILNDLLKKWTMTREKVKMTPRSVAKPAEEWYYSLDQEYQRAHFGKTGC